MRKWMKRLQNLPRRDNYIRKHSAAKNWLHLNSLLPRWLKLKRLKSRDGLQKRGIFTSRIISLVAAGSTNAFLSGKPCSSKFN